MRQKQTKTIFLPKGSIIEIIGNVASGKTTTARKISRISTFAYIDVDVYNKNPFLPLFVQDPIRWTFTNDLYFSYIRSQQIKETQSKMLTNPIVLDSSFDMGIYVYSKNCFLESKLNDDEWDFLQKLHKSLMQEVPEITATIFLDVPVDELMRRIIIRGREHEQEYSRKYVVNLQKRLHEYKKSMLEAKKKRVIATYHQLEKRLEIHRGKYTGLAGLFKAIED